MDSLRWNDLWPLPNDIYTNLVRFFYCNLEIGTLENIEYTIDSRVIRKNIVLTLTILFEITGIANTGEWIFISKSTHLDQYVSRKRMNEIIAVNEKVEVTQTKHLKKEFRLFHKYIAYNIISKARHYNQVTNMDAFIIYKASIN